MNRKLVYIVIAGIVAFLLLVRFDPTGTFTTLNPFGPKVVIVNVEAGKATITDREDDDLSHLKMECNNGLVVECDWDRNPQSEFGYDIYEPTVSEDYNQLAVMILCRGVIAPYLRGEYD
jgi:hypothetical protein